MPPRSNRPPETIGYGRQSIDDDDIAAVVAVLRGETLTQGPAVPAFERALEAATGAPHAVAVANGTCALHLAYHALGVGPLHSLLTTANTFLATATAAKMCGAEVEFVDIDARTGNLDVEAVEERLKRGRAPHVITAVHFAGLPCDMEWLINLKRKHGFLLVEDAAHALGARYKVDGSWYRVGEHPEVDATILSFHPVKHVTTGEGGAVLVHDASLAARLRRLRAHGIDPDGELALPGYLRMSPEAFAADGRHTPWFRPMTELGFNHRLTDFQAALGTSQLEKLPRFLKERNAIAARYRTELAGFGLPPEDQADRANAWHLFVVRCGADERDDMLRHLHTNGIRAQVHYYPVPLQPWFLGGPGGVNFPHAVAHARTSISLPIFPGLTSADQARVIGVLMEWKRARAAA